MIREFEDIAEEAIDWLLKDEGAALAGTALNDLKGWLERSQRHREVFAQVRDGRQLLLELYGDFMNLYPPRVPTSATSEQASHKPPPLDESRDPAGYAFHWVQQTCGKPISEAQHAMFIAWLHHDPAHYHHYYYLLNLWKGFLQQKRQHIYQHVRTAKQPQLAELDLDTLKTLAAREEKIGQDLRRREYSACTWQMLSIDNQRKPPQPLKDGTLCELRERTVLRARLSPTRRELRLQQGEVYLRVAPAVHWPLELHTQELCISSGGANFGVRHSGGALLVYVRAGSLRITEQGQRESSAEDNEEEDDDTDADEKETADEILLHDAQMLRITAERTQIHSLTDKQLFVLCHWANLNDE